MAAHCMAISTHNGLQEAERSFSLSKKIDFGQYLHIQIEQGRAREPGQCETDFNVKHRLFGQIRINNFFKVHEVSGILNEPRDYCVARALDDARNHKMLGVRLADDRRKL